MEPSYTFTKAIELNSYVRKMNIIKYVQTKDSIINLESLRLIMI
jgi:hypothetical protein